MEYAPELIVETWLNTAKAFSLQALRGQVVLIEAFQMLCPGCVSHALPQAQEVARTFASEDLVVLGLHTVFEHHNAQGGAEVLKAFLHEYRLTFPVGIDTPSQEGATPKTMAAYQMQGTPTTILIDRNGRLRMKAFGRVRDLVLGAQIAALLGEARLPLATESDTEATEHVERSCDASGCPLPAEADT